MRAKIAGALLTLLTASSAVSAPTNTDGFGDYVRNRTAPLGLSAADVLPFVQGGTTTALPLGALAAYLQVNLPIITMLGFTPLAINGDGSKLQNITPAQIGAQPALGFTPLAANGSGAQLTGITAAQVGAIAGTKSGSTAIFATVTGALTNGHCVSLDGLGNLIDAGAPCGSGGSGGSGSVASAQQNQIAYYPSASAAVAGLNLAGLTITNGALGVVYGTAANTAAQGNDSRITGALQNNYNLADLANATTARANLGAAARGNNTDISSLVGPMLNPVAGSLGSLNVVMPEVAATANPSTNARAGFQLGNNWLLLQDRPQSGTRTLSAYNTSTKTDAFTIDPVSNLFTHNGDLVVNGATTFNGLVKGLFQPQAGANLVGSPTVNAQGLWLGWNRNNAGETDVINQKAGGTGGIMLGEATTGNGVTESAFFSPTLSRIDGPIASPVFTGTPTTPTPATSDNSTKVASTAYVQAVASNIVAGSGGAPTNSPAFTGTPTAPTPAATDSSTTLSTTAFVGTAVANLKSGVVNKTGDTMTGNLFAPVLGTGATAARTLSDRVADGFSALDFGAKCDGSTDDTNALRALLAAGAALNVTIELVPPGKTCLTQSLNVRSNSHLRIDGTLKSVSGVKSNLVANDSFVRQTGGPYETNVMIEGQGTIDNGQPSTYNVASTGVAPVSCIAGLGPVSGWTIRDVTAQNCGAWPINFNGSSSYVSGGSPTTLATHIDIEHVSMLHSGNSFQMSNCDNCWARDFYVSDIADFCAAFYGNVHNSGMVHMRGDQCASGGIAVLTDGNAAASPRGANTYVSTDLVIDEPIVSRTGGPAIFIDNQATGVSPVQQHQNIRIVSPEGYQNNYSNQTNFGGLFCSHANNVKTINAHWHNDGPTSGTNGTVSGETYSDTCSNPTSIGTTITDEGGNGGTGNAIAVGVTFLNGGPANPTIMGLSVVDDQATKTMAYAVNGAIASGGSVMGTTVSGLAGATFGPNFARAAQTTVLGNQGADNYTPQNIFSANYQATGSVSGATLRSGAAPSTCNGQATGTLYNSGDNVARFCP